MTSTVWSGTISFGLVSIPVKLQPATRSHDIHFNLLHRKCGNRIQVEYYCPVDDETIKRSDLAKGYEYEKGRYVIIEDADLEAIEPESSSNLEIEQFTSISEIDPIFFEKSYYVVPATKDNEKAYILLTEAMKETGRAAIGKLLMRDHEYLVVIRPGMNGLIAHFMLYGDEIRKNESKFTQIRKRPAEKELELAKSLVENLTKSFEPSRFKNIYIERLEDLIEAKAKGRKVTIYSTKKTPRVADLMEALRKSVERSNPRKAGSRRVQKASA